MNEELERMRAKYSERNFESPIVSRSEMGGAFICSQCGSPINLYQKFCTTCGALNIKDVTNGTKVELGRYQHFFSNGDDGLLRHIIEEEFLKNGVAKSISLPTIENKKTIFCSVYSIITFILLALTLFHVNYVVTLLAEAIITIIYFCIIRKYNIAKFLIKEIKSRPDEKMSYIIASTISGANLSNYKDKIIRSCIFFGMLFALLVTFTSPKLIYEKMPDGNSYSLRYYTLGILKNDAELTIPENYNGKPVIGIRGDVFKNVFTIKKVILPDSIKEIRAGAFKNCTNLQEINLPKGITEIKGSTFEGCSSLRGIEIPEGVTRIGGSAFRDNISLSYAVIPTTVNEIGSSAFRNTALRSVRIPRSASVNSRAFKGTNVSIYYYEDTRSDRNEYREW